MAVLPDKYPPLFATIEPTMRNVPVDPEWGVPDVDGGHVYHEAVFYLFTGVQCNAAVIDGKYVPGLDDVTVSQIADLMYVVSEGGQQLRPERPITIIDCPNGHGKMRRMAALSLNLGLEGDDGRKFIANVPVLDVPTCPKCGAAAFDREVYAELNRRMDVTLRAGTMTTITVAQNPQTGRVAYVRRLVGPNIQLLDPERGIVNFATLNEAVAAVPKDATKLPDMPNEIEGVVGVWLIETAKMPDVRQYN